MADQGYRLVAVRQWANQVDRVGWRLAETDDFLRLAIVQEGKIVAAEPGDRTPSLHYLTFPILMLTKLIHSTGAKVNNRLLRDGVAENPINCLAFAIRILADEMIVAGPAAV